MVVRVAEKRADFPVVTAALERGEVTLGWVSDAELARRAAIARARRKHA